MEMEIRNRVLDDVSPPREPEVAHLALHDDFLVFLTLERGRVGGLEDLNCAVDAGLQLVEGGFCVLHFGLWDAAYALDEEFGCVAAGLDLVGDARGC